MNKHDKITMRLPKKADYVSLIRLTVSGMASKIGFDIDAIEDIKVAISEVCNRIVSLDLQSSEEDYSITFHLYPTGFKACFSVTNQVAKNMFTGESGEFAHAIISSFMDEFNIECDKTCIITMGKNLGDEVNE